MDLATPIPDADDTLAVACHDGATIIVRRLARPGRPRLLLSHGNGFAIDGFAQYWTLLANDYELCLHDLRNHGRNPRHDVEAHTIANMARDHLAVRAAIDAAFDPRPTGGVYHSAASIAAIRAAAEHGQRWDALMLVDPPLIAPPGDPLREANQGLDDFLADLSRKRQHHFETTDELAAQYRAKSGRTWNAGAEYDMARGVTRPAPQGGFELSCPGEYEARIYLNNASYDSFAALGAMRQPTMLLGADPDRPKPMTPALTGPKAAAAHNLPHVIIRGTGHLLQIEKPAECAQATRAFFAQHIG